MKRRRILFVNRNRVPPTVQRLNELHAAALDELEGIASKMGVTLQQLMLKGPSETMPAGVEPWEA